MKLSAPKKVTFWIAIILLLVGLCASFLTGLLGGIPVVGKILAMVLPYCSAAGCILLILGCLVKGL